MQGNDLIPPAKLTKNAHASTPKPMEICKLKILPVKNVEPSIFLVDGYIRKQTFKMNILPEINNLIYSFYQKMNGTSIVWKINNIDTLLNNTNQNDFKSFESNVYPIHTSFQHLSKSQQFLNNSPFKVYLKIHFDDGIFTFYIVLVSIPSILDHIHFMYQLYCTELNNYWSCNDHLFYKDSLCKLLNNDHPFSSNESNPDISINDLKLLNITSLTFFCSLDIINIDFGDKHKYNLSYCHKHSSHLENNGQLLNNFDMKYDEFRFQWNINNHILNDLKSVNINKMNKYIVSDIYFNMWSLSLTVQYDENNKHSISIQIGLELCVLPSNISGLIIELKLSTNSNVLSLNKCSRSSIQTFNYDLKTYKTDNINMEINNLNELNIFAHLNVIESFDVNEEEISFKVQKRWFEKQKRIKNLPISTKYYDFEPPVTGKLDDRQYFQHISMDKRFDEISLEEIRFQDTKKAKLHSKAAIKKRKKLTAKKAKAAQPPNSGTVGWVFKPHREYHPKKKKIFLYQHICVGEDNAVFNDKSTEELRFEDINNTEPDINNVDTGNGNDNNIDKDGSNYVGIILCVLCVFASLSIAVFAFSYICSFNIDMNHIMNVLFSVYVKYLIMAICICMSIGAMCHNNKINNEFKRWCADNIGLNECYLLLVENGVNELDIFKQLRDGDLLEIGIKKIGDRLKILGKIRELNSCSLHSFDMVAIGFVFGCVFVVVLQYYFLPWSIIA